jgi:hypothetical protein
MELKATISARGTMFDGRAPEIIRRDLLAVMHEATSFLERGVRDKTPQGVFGMEGGLRASIHGEVLEHGTSAIGIVAHGKGTYGDVVEHGRRPGQKMPPEGTLLRWVEIKTGLTGKPAKSVEFLIRRKIGKEGFEGVHMFERTWDESQGKLQQMFNRAGFNIAFHLTEGGGRP